MRVIFEKTTENNIIMKIPSASAKVLYNSGQCFNMYPCEEPKTFKIVSRDKICFVNDVSCSLFPHMSVVLNKNDIAYWLEYFNVYEDFDLKRNVLLYDKCELIRKSAQYGSRLIMLKQDIWETTVSFIISQRKNIPAIRTSLALIREHMGNDIGTDKTIPRPEELLKRKEQLKKCSLGYREKYLIDAAKHFVDGMEDRLKNASDFEKHMEILKEINGIGEKVASCICLFALYDKDAFPEDVWIKRIKDQLPQDMSIYNNQGYLQQLIFYYIINHKEQFDK